MSVDESGPRVGGRPIRLGEGEQTPRPQPRYPDWRDAPLPSGPVPATPPGGSTVRGGGLEGQTLSRLAGSGLRVPILYGRLWVAPDIVHIGWYSFLPFYRVSPTRTSVSLVVLRTKPLDEH